MHVVTKGTLLLGGVGVIVGILMVFAGGSSISNIDDDWFEQEGLLVGSGSSYEHQSEDTTMYVFVKRGEVRCDEFELNVTQEDGSDTGASYKHDLCTMDGDKPMGWEDDPIGYYHMGTINNLEEGGFYQIDSEQDVTLIEAHVIEELVEDVLGGIAGVGGGFACLCCSIVILLIGVILMFFMDDEKPATTFEVDSEGRVILGGQQEVGVLEDRGSEGAPADSEAQAWYEQSKE
tara:strand:+ start:560 stop:1258 length:699 start_codon:yes stop_codon:yes gene_type:complete